MKSTFSPKNLTIIAIVSGLSLITSSYLAYAQVTGNQEAELSIEAGTITIEAPESITFDPVFIPADGQPFYIYKTLDPSDPNSVLQINDGDVTENFKVTMNISGFADPLGNVKVPYDNVGFVTLSSDASGIDGDFNQDGQIDAFESSGAAGPGGPGGGPPPPQIIDPNSLNFTAPKGCVWDPTKTLANICANNFETVSGNGMQSDAFDLLQAPEPNGGRVGAYSMGLGFQILIDPADVEPGIYTSTLTFTLYQCSDTSCL